MNGPLCLTTVVRLSKSWNMLKSINSLDQLCVIQVEKNGIVQLKVGRPARADVVAAATNQTAVSSFHITLVRLDDLGIDLPENLVLPVPPSQLMLEPTVYQVSCSKGKNSCYQRVNAEGQEQLRAYVKSLEELTGLKLQQDDRVYHVTLTNSGGGDLRASVGNVWLFESKALAL